MATATMSLQANTPQEMESIITSYIAQGFVIANRSPVSVTLMKRKEFSVLWTVIGFLLCLLPLLVYLIVYAAQSDQMILINLVNGQQPMEQYGGPQLLAPATAPRSPDGNYWWDGLVWQPVQSLPYGSGQPSTPYQSGSIPYTQPSTPYQPGSIPYSQPSSPYQPGSVPYTPPAQPNTGQPPLYGDGSPYQQ